MITNDPTSTCDRTDTTECQQHQGNFSSFPVVLLDLEEEEVKFYVPPGPWPIPPASPRPARATSHIPAVKNHFAMRR